MWPMPTTSVENTSGADDHLDQAQEDRAAERDVACKQLLRGWIRVMVMDQPASGYAQQHRHE